MNETVTLDSDTGAEAGEAGDPITVTHSLTAAGTGLVAAIEIVADTADECVARLIRFKADGTGAKTLSELQVPDAVVDHGLPVVASMSGTDIAIAALNSGESSHVELLGTKAEKIKQAFDKAEIGNIANSAADKKFIVILSENLDSDNLPVQDLHFLKTSLKTPKIARLVLDGLELNLRRRVTAMTFWNDVLYIAVADSVAGFDLFRVDLSARKPAAEPVMTRGAFRFSLNAAVSALLPTSDALLIGTAALASADVQVGNWGAELIALGPDGHWQVIFGQQRFSPDGLKAPVAEADAGIGSLENSAVSAMAVRKAKDGEEVVLAIQDYWGDIAEDRATVLPDMSGYFGDVRFFKSAPGSGLADWDEIDIDLPEDRGSISGLCFTSAGLAIGHEQLGGEGYPLTIAPVK